MTTTKHKWTFLPRFRRRCFGWRSQPAITRIKEAVAEIKKAARRDPALGAEGAVLFLERLSPALEQVDSSSGAIGTAVNNAIAALAPLIAKAQVDGDLRNQWLERLQQAMEEDEMPYIELLADYWGELCAGRERASAWADRCIEPLRRSWILTARGEWMYYKHATACLSSLFAAGRFQEILDLLDLSPHGFWHHRRWGVKALVAMGRKAEAIRYAQATRDAADNPVALAAACEEILLSSGLADEAYRRYALTANRRGTYLATFRAIVKKYPGKTKAEILSDLVASTPGEEGKWFAAAKSAGLYDEAIDLAWRTPCDPRTLARAARDLAERRPDFALETGLAALHWICQGYGYEITNLDVLHVHQYIREAARNTGSEAETEDRIREILTAAGADGHVIANLLSIGLQR